MVILCSRNVLHSVESSGDLLLVSRIRVGTLYDTDNDFEGDNEDVNFHEDESEEEEDDDDQDQDQFRELGQECMFEIPYVTTGFKILKLQCSAEVKSKTEYEWVNVDSLGDQALFLGGNSSVSLSASSFNGCKVNCIYFTDDNFDYSTASLNGLAYDMGVFSMEDGTSKQHYKGKYLSSFNLHMTYALHMLI